MQSRRHLPRLLNHPKEPTERPESGDQQGERPWLKDLTRCAYRRGNHSFR